MTVPLADGAAELVDDQLAEDAAAFDRLLADVRTLHRLAEQIVLHDRHTGGHDLVQRAGHGFAGHRGRHALCAGVDEVLHQLQLALRRAARLLGDVQRGAEILGCGLGAIDDLLDERVALRMGDEADRLGRPADSGADR